MVAPHRRLRNLESPKALNEGNVPLFMAGSYDSGMFSKEGLKARGLLVFLVPRFEPGPLAG